MNALDYIQTHAPRVPLLITKVISNGAAFATTNNHLVLPTDKGTDLKDFFLSARVVHDADAKEGDYILGVWQNPGRLSWNTLKNMEAKNGQISSAEVISEQEFKVASLALNQTLRLVAADPQEDVSEVIVALQDVLENHYPVASEAITNIVSSALLIRAESRSALQSAYEQQTTAHAALDNLIRQSIQFGKKCDNIEESIREKYKSVERSLDDAKLTTETRQIAVERTMAEYESDLVAAQAEKERIKQQLGTLWPIATALVAEQIDQEWSEAEANLSSIIDSDPRIHDSPLLERSVVMATLLSALTGSVGLLHGSVGVGKTYSVGCVSKRLGANFDVVPVRPSWVEPADLLGYFDPLSAIFRPGPFSEAIKKACHPERLHIVCLDELNLARVENYGADLLSRFEYSKRDNQTYIQLYTDSDFAGLVEEYEGLAALVNGTESPEQRRRRTVLARSIPMFPSRIFLPQGMALIGTLNADETTYELSPKVIDRSYCIQFPNPEIAGIDVLDLDDFFAPDLPPLKGAIRQSQLRGAWNNALKEYALDITMLWDKLINSLPEEPFSDIGIPLARRFYEDFMATCALAKVLELDEREVLEFFVWTKILPRISYRPSQNKNNIARELLKSLNDLCGSKDVAWEHTRRGILDQINDPSAPVVKYFRSSR